MEAILTFYQTCIDPWLKNRLIQSLLIAIVAFFLSRIANAIVHHAIKKRKDVTNRSETLLRVFGKIVSFLIYFFAVLQICEVLFHVQPTSILAATGIVSVALGFGAQTLVKDVISGFFILFENQFSVGELVTIEGFTGTIRDVQLRSTIIQNYYGDLFTVPNGAITTVINHSRCMRSVVVCVNIEYDQDINAALDVLSQTAETAKKEISSLTQPPEVLGVSALGDSGVELKLLVHCEIGEQFAVEREMLRRVKYAFDSAEIEIPYKTISLVNKDVK